MPTKLSVNINKIATLRNARGGDVPNLIKAALAIQNFGADGITVHPRPDQRHIRYSDVKQLKKNILPNKEFNIEGYPSKKFIALVLSTKPTQVTLVPDKPNQLTSNAGWNTIKHESFLRDIILDFKNKGIRTSIFMECDLKKIEYAKRIGTDRIELYTESYARGFLKNKKKAIAPFCSAANLCHEIALEINAGHDLNLDNLEFFSTQLKKLKEVSIGHALISDSLYIGLKNAVLMYKSRLT